MVVIMETEVNLKDLRAYNYVVDLGSITAAAKASGETKGSISRRISRLERHLNISIIHRLGGRASPTEEGLEYLKKAKVALEILDSAYSTILDQDSKPIGHIRITTAQGIYQGCDLSKYIAQFINKFPEVSMEVFMSEKFLSFREHQINFAFRVSFGQMKDSSHKAIELMDMGACFYAGPEYLRKFGVPTNPSELNQHKLLIPRGFGNGVTISLISKQKNSVAETYELKGHLLCQDIVFLEEVGLSNGGIILKSPSPNDENVANGKLVPILEDWKVSEDIKLYLLYPNKPLSPKELAFKEFISDLFSHR